MLEPTKAHPTRSIEILAIGPEAIKAQVKSHRRPPVVWFYGVSGSIPWRRLPRFSDDGLTAISFSGARHKGRVVAETACRFDGRASAPHQRNGKLQATIERRTQSYSPKSLDTDYRVFL